MFNVLVVDDEKEIRDAIEIYLRGENLNIIKAGDGLEALDLLESNNIHLIILDVMMPKLDGIKTCLEIRKNRNIPIIMLSAKGEDSDKILGLNVGADDYMTKPFNNMEIKLSSSCCVSPLNKEIVVLSWGNLRGEFRAYP